MSRKAEPRGCEGRDEGRMRGGPRLVGPRLEFRAGILSVSPRPESTAGTWGTAVKHVQEEWPFEILKSEMRNGPRAKGRLYRIIAPPPSSRNNFRDSTVLIKKRVAPFFFYALL